MSQNVFGRSELASLISTNVFTGSSKRKSDSPTPKQEKSKIRHEKKKILYRPKTSKVMQHHLLAEAEMEELEKEDNEVEEEEEDLFLIVSKEKKVIKNEEKKRIRSEPIIIKKRKRHIDSSDESEKKSMSDSSKDISESSDDETSESSIMSDESSSSDEEMDALPISKPLFVPKAKRETIVDFEKQYSEKKKAEELRKEKRSLESRALVVQVVSLSKNKKEEINESDSKSKDHEGEGATNERPDDTDKEDVEFRNEWIVRELLRILHSHDVVLEEELFKQEVIKRRQMTDEEIMANNKEENLYKAPGEDRKKEYKQRFYHRGAYYMDDDTLQQDLSDVRHKAKEYAGIVTGDDKFDKRKLPKIMQVKKFGFRGYSTKYKGLAKEDTTDKNLTYLPHHASKKK